MAEESPMGWLSPPQSTEPGRQASQKSGVNGEVKSGQGKEVEETQPERKRRDQLWGALQVPGRDQLWGALQVPGRVSGVLSMARPAPAPPKAS